MDDQGRFRSHRSTADQPHSLEFAVPRLFVPVPSLTSSNGTSRAGLTLNNCRAQIKRKFIQVQKKKN
ncbi:hypothetical protein VN97_g5988 [Penicillium thymicola]|uniref:Uncharacterized protein n=1 Tax=Penicillium thymicola TaxID=293382 RepID=A0AAI9TII5_PENTH|nr:hypothetical protein VN97_g5988 [Penicillium thymicola]